MFLLVTSELSSSAFTGTRKKITLQTNHTRSAPAVDRIKRRFLHRTYVTSFSFVLCCCLGTSNAVPLSASHHVLIRHGRGSPDGINCFEGTFAPADVVHENATLFRPINPPSLSRCLYYQQFARGVTHLFPNLSCNELLNQSPNYS